MDGRVVLNRCKTYNTQELKDALIKCLTPFGGLKNFIKPGQRVALKPNLLLASSPDDAVVTHPSFVGAVAEMVTHAGGKPFIIDSPGAGYPYTEGSLRRLYKRCGYMDILPPVELNFDCSFKEVPYHEARVLKRFEISAPVLEADVIINLPKVKTHGLTFLTCGVKNLFGVVPGMYKSAYHGRFKDTEGFSGMLIDLCRFVKPALTICDGIIGMEGDGPSRGKKRFLGLIAISSNPFLVDMVISRIIGFDPLTIPYLKLAVKEGLCPEDIDSIDVLADDDTRNKKVPFVPPQSLISEGLNRKLKRILLLNILCSLTKRLLTIKPRINRRQCSGCGICIKACPEKAIKFIRRKARIRYDRCIRCYCCHELCPHSSISLKRPLLNRMLGPWLQKNA